MRILISGGCKMGKSTLAQRLAVAQRGQPVYIATMRPHDEEDLSRIARHKREREGWGFQTVEISEGIEQLCGRLAQDASLLLDSTTALLAEEMFPRDRPMDAYAPRRVRDGLLRLLAAYDRVVVVSDSIYADGIRYAESTEAYRRGLAMIDCALASAGDALIEMSFGQPTLYKGGRALSRWLREDVSLDRDASTIRPLNGTIR